MTPSSAARPTRRPVWGDVRFLIGIALVLASVVGVWLVVSASRHTEPVYAAARTIIAGQTVTTEDLRVVHVGLGPVEGSYLGAGEEIAGLVAGRTIADGELIARGALGDPDDVATTTLVLRSAVDVPASVGAGAVVEVWSAPLAETGEFDMPRILVPDAIVVSVARDESAIGGGEAAVEVVIPRADVAATLAAMADGSALSVVPTAVRAP